MVEQCVPLVCFKDGSDEIVGVNMNFVMSQEDNFMRTFSKQVISSYFFPIDFNGI